MRDFMSGLNKNTTGWAFLRKSGVSQACFRFSLSLWAPSAPWAHEDHVYSDYPDFNLDWQHGSYFIASTVRVGSLKCEAASLLVN